MREAENKMRELKKKLAAVIVAVCVCMTMVQSVFADQDGPDVKAEAYCVLNLKDNTIVFSKNMSEKHYPASITKIMTALVTLENCDDLDEKVVFNSEVMNSISSNSSTLNPVGVLDEEMTVRDALYGLMLNSANECASALAVHVAGSIDAFVDMMNDKAAEIGAQNTHFVNAHGLHDDDHYTTAYDMALIFQAALENAQFRVIDSTSSHTIPATNKSAARDCVTTNRFLNGALDFEGVYAGKTGSTAEAGKTLCTAAYRNGVALICVVLQSDKDNSYTDTETLLDHAFAKAMGTEGEEFSATDDFVLVSGTLTNGLVVREFPSTYSKAVASLSAGESVYRIGTFGNWSLVQTPAGNYYVSSAYLLNRDSTPVETQTVRTTLKDSSMAITEPDLSSQGAEEESEEQSSEAAAESSAVEPSQAETLSEQTQTQSQQQATQPQQTWSYRLNADALTMVIVAVVALMAVVVGILAVVLIRKKADERSDDEQ